jgi:hypothetical protein
VDGQGWGISVSRTGEISVSVVTFADDLQDAMTAFGTEVLDVGAAGLADT